MPTPKKPNVKKAIRKAVRDVKSYAKAKGLKTRSDAGGGGSGIFSQFEGAKYSNKRQWVNTPWPADQKRTMTVFDRQELTRKMRWLAVNAGLVRQMISDNQVYAVGDGRRPQPQTDDASWNDDAYAYFMAWANKPCEITNRYNYWECQALTGRRVDIDGEMFILKTFGSGADASPKIQLIESHRVGTSAHAQGAPDGMTDGILFNKFGAVVGYNVIRSDGTTRLVPANSMLHVYHPETVSGARAYSPLQHSINNLIDILEILSLEKVAMKVQSDVVRTVTRENPQFDGSTADFEAFGMRPQDYPNGVYNNPEQVGAFIGGKTVIMAPGEEMKMVESMRPSPNVIGAIEYLERDSCGGVSPYAFVGDPTKSSGSTTRLVVAKADRGFQARGHMLDVRMNTPIWGYVIGTAIANGDLRPNDQWANVEWVGPRRITVDAGRDSAANQREIEGGLKTLEEHFAEQSQDARTQLRKNAQIAKYIQDLSNEFGVPPSSIFKAQNVPLADINDAAKQAETGTDQAAGKAAAEADTFSPIFGDEQN